MVGMLFLDTFNTLNGPLRAIYTILSATIMDWSWTDLTILRYGFLNKRVRYAIEFTTARYPIRAIKLATVEAMNGW